MQGVNIMTRRMYRAQMEVKRESRKPHRTRSDFERQERVRRDYEEFENNYYSGRRGYDQVYAGR